MNSTTGYANHNTQNWGALKVHAFGNLDGWFYSILSPVDGQLLSRGFGLLSVAYQCWNPHSATLYSLAQAQRFIAKNFPDSRVIMICTAAPVVQTKKGRVA
jgi:hypothetical protein